MDLHEEDRILAQLTQVLLQARHEDGQYPL